MAHCLSPTESTKECEVSFANLFLLGIIPSQAQGKEPKHLDPFLEVLVDEILFLSNSKVYDAYRKAPFDRPPQRSFHLDAWFHKAHDNAKNNAQSMRIAPGTGCRGIPGLAKNPSFDRVEQTVPDTMHTVAVQVKHLVKCIAGKAPEDSLAVRLQEKSLGRFQQSWPNATYSTSFSKHDGV